MIVQIDNASFYDLKVGFRHKFVVRVIWLCCVVLVSRQPTWSPGPGGGVAALLGQVHLPARLLGSGRGTAGPPCAGGLQSHRPHPPVPHRLARLAFTLQTKFCFRRKSARYCAMKHFCFSSRKCLLLRHETVLFSSKKISSRAAVAQTHISVKDEFFILI